MWEMRERLPVLYSVSGHVLSSLDIMPSGAEGGRLTEKPVAKHYGQHIDLEQRPSKQRKLTLERIYETSVGPTDHQLITSHTGRCAP